MHVSVLLVYYFIATAAVLLCAVDKPGCWWDQLLLMLAAEYSLAYAVVRPFELNYMVLTPACSANTTSFIADNRSIAVRLRLGLYIFPSFSLTRV